MLYEGLLATTYTIFSGECMSVFTLSGCEEISAALHQAQPTPRPAHYLSQDGVGPINAATPFNLHLIGDAFQGLMSLRKLILLMVISILSLPSNSIRKPLYFSIRYEHQYFHSSCTSTSDK